MLWSVLLSACRCSGVPDVQVVKWPDGRLSQVGGRFRGQEDAQLDPAVAFQVEKDCPRVERATLRRKNEVFSEIEVTGSGLDRVVRVSAAMVDGTLAEAAFEPGNSSLRFPVACADCTIFLGTALPDRTVACVGSGYSLRIEHGLLVP